MKKDSPEVKGQRALAIEEAVKEKLFNKKYYRSIDIDTLAEETTADKAKAAKSKTKAKGDGNSSAEVAAAPKTPEDYKAILRGMGFDV
jgi:hypothetical protein